MLRAPQVDEVCLHYTPGRVQAYEVARSALRSFHVLLPPNQSFQDWAAHGVKFENWATRRVTF